MAQLQQPAHDDYGHWRCRDCKTGFVYSRGSEVNYSHLWLCCRFGFGLNSTWTDVACSCCSTGITADYVNASAIPSDTTVDVFNTALGYATVPHENDESSSVPVFPLGPRLMQDSVAADDLTSIICENISRLETFEENFNQFGTFDCHLDDSRAWVPTPTNAFPDRIGSRTSLSTVHQPREATVTPATPLCRTLNTKIEGRMSLSSTSIASAVTVESYLNKDRNLDSAYGTMINGVSDSIKSSNSRKRKPHNTQTCSTMFSRSNDTSSVISSKRARQLDAGEPLLACPFFKRNPNRCTHRACAGPGYVSFSRLKQNIQQSHLQFRCERCQALFIGRTAAKDLEYHRQTLEGCTLQARGDFWGIDQHAFGNTSRRRGMSRESRWTILYRELFGIDDATELPSPYVEDMNDKTNTYAFRNLLRQDFTDNLVRELLRLLPSRLDSRIGAAIRDDRFRSLWTEFAANH